MANSPFTLSDSEQQSIIDLIDTRYAVAKLSKNSYPTDPHKRRIKEWGTFHLHMNRRAGHSTLALKLLEKYNNSYLFTYTWAQAEDLRKEVNSLKKHRIFPFCKIDELPENSIVIVDTAFWTLSKKKRERIYDKMPEFCIFLQ